MAIIYSYPKTAPLAADLLIVSRQPSDPDETANYSVSVSDIATLVTGLQQYTLKAGTKAGTSVPLTLDSDTGTDSTVNFTEGTNITLTQTSATEITIAASAGGATSLNGLTDVLIDGTSSYLVEVPSGLSGNPAGNTTFGDTAALSLTSGSNNTIIGEQAGKLNGSQRTFVGQEAGINATGQVNCAFGKSALRNSTGQGNVAFGSFAGDSITSGINNTSVGNNAGSFTLTTGSNNMMLGNLSLPTASGVSNEITLGNSSISVLRCAVTSITSLSDARDKTNVKDLSYGIDFIKSLTPREFTWDNRSEKDVNGNDFYSENKGKKDFGFVAQEVQALDNDTLRLVYSSNPEKLEMSYGKLVPILVQAVKELTARLEALEN